MNMMIFQIFMVIILVLQLKCSTSQSNTNNNLNTCKYVDYSLYTKRGLTSLYDDARGYGNLTNRDGCSPQQIWSVVRHGARYPAILGVSRMSEILDEVKEMILQVNADGKGHLCREDIEALRQWKMDEIMVYESNFLAQSGKNELFLIGDRLRKHFPNLLNTSYNPNKFQFGYSSTQRGIQTLRYFTEGLFKNDPNYKSYYVGQPDIVAERDCHVTLGFPVLRDLNYEASKEVLQFSTTSKLFERISTSTSQRTGLPNSTLTKDVILALYDSCVYESAMHLDIAPFCRIFELSDLELMRERDNIMTYFVLSYGNKNHHFFGCAQLKDLIVHFDNSVKNKSDGFTMKAHFSHDVTMTMMFTAMGCFRDSPTLSPDYSTYNASQIWTVDTQTPFSANVHAVLYNCNTSNDYELQFFLNENPIGCCMTDSKEACSWREFKEYHYDFTSNCREDYCNEESGYAPDEYLISSATTRQSFAERYFFIFMIIVVTPNWL